MTLLVALGFVIFGLLLQLPAALRPSNGGMDAKAVMVISGTVVLLTQLAKWGGVPDKRGPWAVLVISLLGILFWGWSQGDMSRATAFDYFAGFVAVAAASAGIFGFTRSMPEAVTATTQPPAGAGSNSTSKP